MQLAVKGPAIPCTWPYDTSIFFTQPMEISKLYNSKSNGLLGALEAGAACEGPDRQFKGLHTSFQACLHMAVHPIFNLVAVQQPQSLACGRSADWMHGSCCEAGGHCHPE